MSAVLGPWAAAHLAAAAWVLTAGGMQLARPKGGAVHRWLGRSWLPAMGVVALSSFGIHTMAQQWHGFSAIHLLSLWVLWCIGAALVTVRRGQIAAHRRWVVGAYWGAVIAGLLAALAPGRWLNLWLTSIWG